MTIIQCKLQNFHRNYNDPLRGIVSDFPSLLTFCKWKSPKLKTKLSLYFTVLSATCKLVCTPNPSLLNEILSLLFDKSQLIRQEHKKGSKGLCWIFCECVSERERKRGRERERENEPSLVQSLFMKRHFGRKDRMGVLNPPTPTISLSCLSLPLFLLIISTVGLIVEHLLTRGLGIELQAPG